jgi:hypothetical protein
MLIVIMLNIVVLNVIMLSVIAPFLPGLIFVSKEGVNITNQFVQCVKEPV